MKRVPSIEAIQGGLEGDRYQIGTGYWADYDECQVTLIRAEDIEQIATETGISVTNGEHRRNIITRGVDLMELRGKRFRVGDAVLEFDRPRPPCRYVQTLTEPGMTKALGHGRGGICARVIEPGTITEGAEIAELI